MRFKNKPVTIEAVHFDGVNDPPGVFRSSKGGAPFVVTIHGEKASVAPGDWIITEPDGEHHYPCKPDIFDKRYEPAE